MISELDTSKEREKFTDHDGGVRFLKSQKIKKLYVYKGENGSPRGEGGKICPPL